MHSSVFIIIAGILFLLIASYTVIPTMMIRMHGKGITKKLYGKKGMALTFDDGPNPEYTVELLDLLKRYQIKAAFFVVGHKVKKYPDIIKRMHNEGHLIGIHHYHHLSNWVMLPFVAKRQLKMTERAIMNFIDEKVRFYRPPWGHFNLFTKMLSKDYQIVMWSHICVMKLL